MLNQPYQMHENDREQQARGLGLTLSQFDNLVASANKAYEVIMEMGPFYGREEIKEPTFRIAAEPVYLPKESKEQVLNLGTDLLYVAHALNKLPIIYKDKLGEKVDYKIPPTWRIDAILTEDGKIRMNELEGVDSASALMVAEQLAYNLQDINESTAALLIKAIKDMVDPDLSGKYKIAVIRATLEGNPHTPNAKRFVELLEKLSQGSFKVDLFDGEQLRAGIVKPDWTSYSGVINEALFSAYVLSRLGIREKLRISSGNYNAIGNKGVFALIFDEKLKAFWEQEIGAERLNRLQSILIPTRFIETEKELDQARKAGEVVKVSWANNMILLNRSKGVALPEGDLEQSSDQRWNQLKELLTQGVRLISQQYIKPGKIKAYLRKRGTTLEMVEWYNRVCVKYVANGDPNAAEIVSVSPTAIEVTLGPGIVPAGRQCAFTAGTFK